MGISGKDLGELCFIYSLKNHKCLHFFCWFSTDWSGERKVILVSKMLKLKYLETFNSVPISRPIILKNLRFKISFLSQDIWVQVSSLIARNTFLSSEYRTYIYMNFFVEVSRSISFILSFMAMEIVYIMLYFHFEI